MKIFLIIVAILIVLSAGGALLFGPTLMDKLDFGQMTTEGIEVRTQTAETGSLVESISAPGEIEPHTDVEISAQVSAKILQLPFREGENVKQGDLICKLDDRDVRAELNRAEARRDGERFSIQSNQAQLAGLMNNLDFAQRELDRVQSLFDSGDNSRKDLDAALERVRDLDASIEATKHSISVAESSLAASEADIERAQDALDHTTIEAPMDGVITRLNVEVGEQVLGTLSNVGTTIMTIANLDRMILNAEVAESDVAKVKPGQKAKIYINAFQDEVWDGTVRRIALQRSGAADGTGFFETEVEVDLSSKPIGRSGLVANVDIEIESHEGIIIESQAIQSAELEELPDEVTKDNELIDRTKTSVSVVYRVIDGKAVCTPVKAGPSDIRHRIVLEGLSAGDDVIIGPYKVLETIEHDEAVTIEGASSEDEESADEEVDTEPAEDATEDAEIEQSEDTESE